jgi:hypothetical protein
MEVEVKITRKQQLFPAPAPAAPLSQVTTPFFSATT